jgi:hypothetical protein
MKQHCNRNNNYYTNTQRSIWTEIYKNTEQLIGFYRLYCSIMGNIQPYWCTFPVPCLRFYALSFFYILSGQVLLTDISPAHPAPLAPEQRRRQIRELFRPHPVLYCWRGASPSIKVSLLWLTSHSNKSSLLNLLSLVSWSSSVPTIWVLCPTSSSLNISS